MNKQQLASKIWASANKMRSKIEANEYKDYILGFIFYKFLSDSEVNYLKSQDWTDGDMKTDLVEEDEETVAACQSKLGYFIAYKDLFSTWINPSEDFSVGNVRDALTRFARLINAKHEKVYKGIFDTLQNGLSKLGENAGAQTKAIRDLLNLIRDIPTSGKQDYDVLGFIYEYLIGNFAANAGKKAGEFYTPHEVALMMSEIVAHHLRGKEEIRIYDPTSGSGSLLLNIGRSVSKYMTDKNKITYFAQELKEPTYNLTRMNLVMRGILPDNIAVRNGDTLEEDWPMFDEADPHSTYEPLYCDAVVSNPPYSQEWNPTEDSRDDERYKHFGVAPKGTADYAFLLHDLYHVKPDGIMTIVLPHGVLFRGGSEEEIRRNLIEKNKIDAIIGLPANIFFGTGIPTLVMVLRQKRDRDDILFVDASRGFVKEGKNNKLRARDIRKIVDAVTRRLNIPNFSRAVSRDEIRKNEYNLNISLYVSSADADEQWDIYSTMFGSIPNSEIDSLSDFWTTFPTLRSDIFEPVSEAYSKLKTEDVRHAILDNMEVFRYGCAYSDALQHLPEYLHTRLIDAVQFVKINSEFENISEHLFGIVEPFKLIDRYAAYQLLSEAWQQISGDLEILQSEGLSAANVVDPRMVIKKKDGKEQEVQDGWIGRILPFDLVQKEVLGEELARLQSLKSDLEKASGDLADLVESLTPEQQQKYLNDNNDAFVAKPVNDTLKQVFADVFTPDIDNLLEYQALSKKKDKLDFLALHPEFEDFRMAKNKDGIYTATVVKAEIARQRAEYEFPADSLEAILVKASSLMAAEKLLKADVKTLEAELVYKTKETIEALSEDKIRELLHAKWITPLTQSINLLSAQQVLDKLTAAVNALSIKYAETLSDIDRSISVSEDNLATMIDDLTGNDLDMAGLRELQKLLRHE